MNMLLVFRLLHVLFVSVWFGSSLSIGGDAKLALKDTTYEGLEEYLSGPTALAYSEDPVAAAKAAVEFAKTNDKLEIVGGSMGGQLLDEAGIKALASMTAAPVIGSRSAARRA